MFGEDEGAAQVCAELGLVHHPHVEQHASGRNRLDYMFLRASQMARHEYLCYCNCDIILMDDFRRAFEKAQGVERAVSFRGADAGMWTLRSPSILEMLRLVRASCGRFARTLGIAAG